MSETFAESINYQLIENTIKNTKGLLEYIGEAETSTDVLKFVLKKNNIISFHDIVDAKNIVDEIWDEYWKSFL